VSKRLGAGSDKQARTVVAAGFDAILAGTGIGDADLGLGPLLELGDPMVGDFLLARYTPTLSTLWQKRFADTRAGGAAVTAGGDVLITGAARGDVDFGGGVLTGAGPPLRDLVVARFDASGKHLWSHRWGDAADQAPGGLAVDAQGDALVIGSFAGSLAIGPGAPLASVGTTDLFVARLDPAGNELWKKSYGTAANLAQGRAIAVDSAGNTLFAGYFTGTLDLGGPLLVSQGDDDLVIAKLDPAGTPLWSRSFGGAGSDRALGVAVGPGDAVFLTGSFHGVVTFGALSPISSPSVSDSSGFLVKLDKDGTPLWVRSQSEPVGMAVGADQQGISVAVDAEGNAVITGSAIGTTVFDTANPLGSTRVGAGATDVFVAKYGPAGALIWARIFGDSSSQVGVSTAIDPFGAVWATGSFGGTIDFGAMPPAVITSLGAVDIYLARFSP
jgi:hypothetical protein